MTGRDLKEASPERPVKQDSPRDPLLKDPEFLLSAVLENSRSSVYFKDLQSRFVRIGSTLARLLKLGNPEDAIGKSDADFFAAEHAREVLADEQEIIRSGHSIVEKDEAETWPDGQVTFAVTSKMPLVSPDGRTIGTMGISRDVTESRRVQQSLVESEARFQELVSAVRDVFWIREAGTGKILYVSPAYETVWGKPIGTMNEDPLGWAADVHEADRQDLMDLYTSDLSEPFAITFRIYRPDGKIRWINQRGYPILDQDKRVVRIVEVSADVTEARTANQTLARTQRLLSSIVNSSHDAIFSESLDGTIMSWNPAAEKMLGYSTQEIVGRSGRRLFGADQDREASWILERTRRGLPVQNPSTTRRHKNGRAITVSLSSFPLRDETGALVGTSSIVHDISVRKRLEEKLSTVEAQLRVVLETTGEQVLELDRDWCVTYVNRGRTGEALEEVVGRTLWEYAPEFLGTVFEAEYRKAMAEKEPRRFEGYLPESKSWYSCMAYPTADGLLILVLDVTERHALDDQLRSAQKMEAIGQLAAGIAHEINTPIQYVGDNTMFVRESWEQAVQVLHLAQRLRHEFSTGEVETATRAEFDASVRSADLAYLFDEVPKAIEQALDGIHRVAKIVGAMKEFSHPGSAEKAPLDLNKAIESTKTVARNEWKYVADVELQLDPGLPMVECLAGEMNQVLLNLIINASHAIGEAKVARNDQEKGVITISTAHDEDWVEVRVKDTGTGIPEKIRDKIFDPFFTTKEVGKGTGQGLTLAQTVVVKKHAGKIWFETQVGQGTTFVVRLPRRGAAS